MGIHMGFDRSCLFPPTGEGMSFINLYSRSRLRSQNLKALRLHLPKAYLLSTNPFSTRAHLFSIDFAAIGPGTEI